MAKDTLDAELRNYARVGCTDGWKYVVTFKSGTATRYYDQDRLSALTGRFASSFGKVGSIPVFVFSGCNVARYREECEVCHKGEDDCECQEFAALEIRGPDALEGGGFVRSDEVVGIRYLLYEDDHAGPSINIEADEEEPAAPPAPAPTEVPITPIEVLRNEPVPAPTPPEPVGAAVAPAPEEKREQPGPGGFTLT